MALQATVQTEYGIPATYHRIIGVQVYYPERLLDLVLASYVSPEARNTNAKPIATITGIRIGFADMGLEGDSEPTREAAYAAIKAKADAAAEGTALRQLAGAADC